MIKKKPFVNYLTEEEREAKKLKEKSEIISLRINEEERQIINVTKDLFNIDHDAKAIKLLMKWSYFVIHGRSTADLFRYLFKKNRAKKHDFDNFDI